MRIFKLFFTLCICLIISKLLLSQNESRLMRFPAMSNDQIVFTYAGDLYTVNKSGGIARKLTNDNGFEMFARFSPNGKTIAFSAQYDGNTEVYTIPAEGGVPKRLTYTATLGRDDVSDRMGPNNVVMGWKNDNAIIYRSRKKSFNDFKGQLFDVSVNGGLSEELPLPCGGFCSYSPDKSKLAYNRVFREFRTWKYYKGGMADDVWIYDFKTKKTENITNNPAQDIFPMWKDNVVYFLSDRDRTMNLFSCNLETKEIKKLTNFTEFDIKFPSLSNNAIIFENGGFIYIYDLSTQKYNKVTIQIADDFISGRTELKDASKNIDVFSFAPDGKRIAFGARGDVFSVPAKTGITKNLTSTSTAHDRDVSWSPDGKYIAFISDMTGENEIYIAAQDGTEKPIQITKNSDTYKYNIVWSQDSKKILWSDKMQRLQFVDIISKNVTLVDKTLDGEFNSYSWSPDSKWIVYTRPDRSSMTKIYFYELATSKKFPVTEGWYDSDSPCFSNDGKYLYFVSSRDFNPIYSWTEWNHAYINMNKIFILTLSKNTASPFKPINDEVNIKSDQTQLPKDIKEQQNTDVKVDIDGIESRIAVLPIEASGYFNLQSTDDGLYYIKRGALDTKSDLMFFDIKEKKENKIISCNNFEISADNKKMLLSIDGRYSIVDISKMPVEPKEFVDLSDMKVMVNHKEEWKQIYDEAWRQMRDFFYDPNMHGVDWKAMHNKYDVLVPYVNHRADLTYIIGELIGELSCGHAYVGGGDRPQAEKIPLGLLGAELSKDESGFYKINKILKGENWLPNSRSPLTEIGVDIAEGEFIIAVNGKPTKSMIDIYESLVNTAGKQVELTINKTPSENGCRKVIIVPTNDESNLYYFNWVRNNIKKVNESTNGEVGYIHIPDMSAEGLNEFVKYFYPQLRKKALIIDDRGNGGGNVSPMIIERINRQLAIMKISRNGTPGPSPDEILVGPKVCLLDRYSASDGDIFPYRFKTLKIGKLIGVRSWGGVVGIRGSLPFIDGGNLSKPEFAHFDAEGKQFVVEGYGVEPDIVVDNDPAKEYAGGDEQLDMAIKVILEEMKTNKQTIPQAPQYPIKNK